MARKPRQVDAVRAFLRECGFPDGEWFVSTKAPLERLMELVFKAEPFTRVWACIYLHSLGWMPTSAGLEAVKASGNAARRTQCKKLGAALALTKYFGRVIPLTTTHIAKEVNLVTLNRVRRLYPEYSEQQIRELNIEIDDETVRRQVVKGEGYGFWARTNNQDVPLSELPDEELQLLNSGKGVGDERTDTGTRIYMFFRPLEETSPRIRGLTPAKSPKTNGNGPIGKPPLLGVERAEQLYFDFANRLNLPEDPAIALRQDVQKKLVEIERKQEELRDLVAKIKAAEMQGQLFPDVEIRPVARSRKSREPQPTAEADPIAATLEFWKAAHKRGEAWIGAAELTYDGQFVEQLVTRCRKKAPDCTREEIAWAVSQKFAIKGFKGGPRSFLKNPHQYVMSVVAELFEGDQLQRRRAEQQEDPLPAAKASCSKCEGSGLIGVKWESIGDLTAAVEHGAEYCSCPEGETTRMLVEPALMRKSGTA